MAGRRTRERTRIEQAAEQRRHKINQDYLRRHPERAAGERALRQAQAKLGPDWRHKREGTAETHEKASRTVQGALARLFMAGAIDQHELGWAGEIAAVHARIVRDVVPATVSLETRVDAGRSGDAVFFEALGRVRAEIAYTAWRAALNKPGVVLAMIVDDMAISAAAKIHGMRTATARAMLVAALNAWPGFYEDAARSVDAADLAAMQAGLS